MEHFLFLLVASISMTHAYIPAPDTRCDATLNSTQCSVTVGGSVYIQVIANTDGYQLRCKKQLPSRAVSMFSVWGDRVTIQDAFRNRTEFLISSGTLKISRVEMSDSGQYTVDVFNINDGLFVKTIQVQLHVKENIFFILIPVCSALAALLILVLLSWCVYRRVRRSRKSDSTKHGYNNASDSFWSINDSPLDQ